MMDLEGVRHSVDPHPLGSKFFHFHGEFLENIGKMVKLTPTTSLPLPPLCKNPGSAPGEGFNPAGFFAILVLPKQYEYQICGSSDKTSRTIQSDQSIHRSLGGSLATRR